MARAGELEIEGREEVSCHAVDPTEVLIAEHRVIRSALSVLIGMARRAERDPSLEPEHARDLITFLRRYADELHQPKEDDVLFPVLGEIGVPRNVGPLALLTDEHGLGRELLDGMSETVDAGLEGEDAARFAELARRYAKMMRAHTDREDRHVFPLARNNLPLALRQRIDESFRRYRSRQAAEQARCIALLEPRIGLIEPA